MTSHIAAGSFFFLHSSMIMEAAKLRGFQFCSSGHFRDQFSIFTLLIYGLFVLVSTVVFGFPLFNLSILLFIGGFGGCLLVSVSSFDVLAVLDILINN